MDIAARHNLILASILLAMASTAKAQVDDLFGPPPSANTSDGDLGLPPLPSGLDDLIGGENPSDSPPGILGDSPIDDIFAPGGPADVPPALPSPDTQFDLPPTPAPEQPADSPPGIEFDFDAAPQVPTPAEADENPIDDLPTGPITEPDSVLPSPADDTPLSPSERFGPSDQEPMDYLDEEAYLYPEPLQRSAPEVGCGGAIGIRNKTLS